MESNEDFRLKKTEEKALDKLNSKLLFNNNHQTFFIFKKTERIAAALYLVTDLIKDSEPLKGSTRRTVLELVSLIGHGSTVSLGDHKQHTENLTRLLVLLHTNVRIAHLAGLISSMNFSILSREFIGLLEILEQGTAHQLNSTLFNDEYFTVAELEPQKYNTRTASEVLSDRMSDSKSFKKQGFSKGQVKDNSHIKDIDPKKSDRRQIILNLLKEGKPLGIKDFATYIKDCSEKTIQRELLALVDQGVLNKIGERRWSTYSLKHA